MAYKTEPLKASIHVRLSLKLCSIFYRKPLKVFTHIGFCLVFRSIVKSFGVSKAGIHTILVYKVESLNQCSKASKVIKLSKEEPLICCECAHVCVCDAQLHSLASENLCVKLNLKYEPL